MAFIPRVPVTECGGYIYYACLKLAPVEVRCPRGESPLPGQGSYIARNILIDPIKDKVGSRAAEPQVESWFPTVPLERRISLCSLGQAAQCQSAREEGNGKQLQRTPHLENPGKVLH